MAENAGNMVYVGKEQAYELYRNNGRSYRRVQELTNIPLGTIKGWAATEKWAERAMADERELGRQVRRGADAWILSGLAKTLQQIDDEVSRVEDVYQPTDDGLIHVIKATPPSVRARLLMWRAELAGLVPAAANDGDDGRDEDEVDPHDLKDDELFATYKRTAHRR